MAKKMKKADYVNSFKELVDNYEDKNVPVENKVIKSEELYKKVKDVVVHSAKYKMADVENLIKEIVNQSVKPAEEKKSVKKSVASLKKGKKKEEQKEEKPVEEKPKKTESKKSSKKSEEKEEKKVELFPPIWTNVDGVTYKRVKEEMSIERLNEAVEKGYSFIFMCARFTRDMIKKYYGPFKPAGNKFENNVDIMEPLYFRMLNDKGTCVYAISIFTEQVAQLLPSDFEFSDKGEYAMFCDEIPMSIYYTKEAESK